jgi:hypothetical protein
MWSRSDVNLEGTAAAGRVPATLAQTRIRCDRLSSSERTIIADLFAILEGLVQRDELPAEARCIYDQAVLLLAQRHR